MSLKNHLTTFELSSERERKLLGNIADGLSNLYDSTKQFYNRTPAIVRAGALVGLGVLGTVAYQGYRERARGERKVYVRYHDGGSGDAKDKPYDFSGYITMESYKRIREYPHLRIDRVDLERE